MTFLDRMFGVSAMTAAASPPPDLEAAAVAPRQVGWQSPMSEPSNLQAVVWADLTGQEAQLVTRDAAMGIPALARQRHLICGVGARCPLRLVDTATVTPGPPPILPTQPEWLTAGTNGVSAYHRMLWTIDDLIFHPFSVWAVERQGSPAGPILWGERVPTERWDVDPDSDQLLIDEDPVDESEVLVILGPHEGTV